MGLADRLGQTEYGRSYLERSGVDPSQYQPIGLPESKNLEDVSRQKINEIYKKQEDITETIPEFIARIGLGLSEVPSEYRRKSLIAGDWDAQLEVYKDFYITIGTDLESVVPPDISQRKNTYRRLWGELRKNEVSGSELEPLIHLVGYDPREHQNVPAGYIPEPLRPYYAVDLKNIEDMCNFEEEIQRFHNTLMANEQFEKVKGSAARV